MELMNMIDQIIGMEARSSIDENAIEQEEALMEDMYRMEETQAIEGMMAQGTMDPVEETPVPAADVAVPPEEAYRHKGMRYKLVYEGVCTHCAHCGQPLTDSDSVERGLGPICSKKGYKDEVTVSDETDALLALAEFPTLVNYLTSKYKAKGNRHLVNGLVRTASLNRRTPVHAACTDAVEALGYKRLASALRESLSVIELWDSKESADSYAMWIKRSDFNWGFWNELKALPGVHMVRFPTRHTVVPKRHRIALANLFIKHYEGLCVKTPNGAHKITSSWFKRAQSA